MVIITVFPCRREKKKRRLARKPSGMDRERFDNGPVTVRAGLLLPAAVVFPATAHVL